MEEEEEEEVRVTTGIVLYTLCMRRSRIEHPHTDTVPFSSYIFLYYVTAHTMLMTLAMI